MQNQTERLPAPNPEGVWKMLYRADRRRNGVIAAPRFVALGEDAQGRPMWTMKVHLTPGRTDFNNAHKIIELQGFENVEMLLAVPTDQWCAAYEYAAD